MQIKKASKSDIRFAFLGINPRFCIPSISAEHFGNTEILFQKMVCIQFISVTYAGYSAWIAVET